MIKAVLDDYMDSVMLDLRQNGGFTTYNNYTPISFNTQHRVI